MKRTMISSIVILLVISCNTETKKLDQLIQDGKFSKAIELIDLKLENASKLSSGEVAVLEKKLYDIKSVMNEYTLSYDDVCKKLKTQIPTLSAQDMKDWEDDYSLEYYVIDGEKKYYYNSIFDLFQVNIESPPKRG